MLTHTSDPISNKLLTSLPLNLRTSIYSYCESIDLEFGSILSDPQTPLTYAYFPLTSFISLVSIVEGHPPLEMGLIGNEGMLGATLSLGVAQTPMRALVQGSGSALRIDAGKLSEELKASSIMTTKFNMYVYVLLTQTARMASCIHFHNIEPRLARWLLMTQDRAHKNRLHLTQDFLANMLGVRRSGITVAAGNLQARNLIHYYRGEITILDREGLQDAACSCYQKLVADYEQILGSD